MDTCCRCDRPVGTEPVKCSCKSAVYCSTRCQNAHKKSHSSQCTVDLKKKLDELRASEGKESIAAAEALIALGDVYDDLDKLTSAKACYQDGLLIYHGKEHNPSRDERASYALHKLSTVLLRLLELDKALEHCRAARAMRQHLAGGRAGEDPHVALCLCTEGEMLAALGRYKEGIAKLEESFQVYVKIHGEMHESVASVLTCIANVLASQGKKTQAVKIFEKALKIQRKTMGDARVGVSLLALAQLYVETGSHQQALDVVAEGLIIAKRNFGSHHQITGKFMQTQASAYLHMGRLAIARSTLETALAVFRQCQSSAGHGSGGGRTRPLVYRGGGWTSQCA